MTRIFCRTLIGPLLLLAFLLGRADASEAILGEIYNRSAQDHGPARNPVILIPGILGSTLEEKQTGEVVWGGFTRRSPTPAPRPAPDSSLCPCKSEPLCHGSETMSCRRARYPSFA